MEKCAICGASRPGDRLAGQLISRCCCDSDWVCADCLATKTLADYVAKAVAYGL